MVASERREPAGQLGFARARCANFSAGRQVRDPPRQRLLDQLDGQVERVRRPQARLDLLYHLEERGIGAGLIAIGSKRLGQTRQGVEVAGRDRGPVEREEDAKPRAVKFVVEELFTNMVKYSVSDTRADIAVGLASAGGRVTVCLTDSGVEPFDVTKAADADVTLGLDERAIGGLGLHLIKRMVDSLDYEYRGRQSIITFSKKLE